MSRHWAIAPENDPRRLRFSSVQLNGRLGTPRPGHSFDPKTCPACAREAAQRVQVLHCVAELTAAARGPVDPIPGVVLAAHRLAPESFGLPGALEHPHSQLVLARLYACARAGWVDYHDPESPGRRLVRLTPKGFDRLEKWRVEPK